MKICQPIPVLLLCMGLLVQCSKKDKTVNKTDLLKGSIWAGEFEYLSGSRYLGHQPFSIVFYDSTFKWFDVDTIAAGSYKTGNNNQVTIRFTGGNTLTADINKDSLSNIKNVTAHNWRILNAVPGAMSTSEQLENTTWNDLHGTSNLKIQFFAGNQLKYSIGPTSSPILLYVFRGAGIYFIDKTSSINIIHYGVLINKGKNINGIYHAFTVPSSIYATWNVSQ